MTQSPNEEIMLTPELLMLVRIYDVLLGLLKATDPELYEKVDRMHESGDFVSNFITTMPFPDINTGREEESLPLFDDTSERLYGDNG